jgi:hypothetical protein
MPEYKRAVQAAARMVVTRAGRPANRPAAMAVVYRFGSATVFREGNVMSFLRKFMLGLLVACALMAAPSAGVASTAHPAAAPGGDSPCPPVACHR